MSIQPSGKLKFSEIENEFGRNSKRSLGEYRIKQTVGEMENLPLDENIPLRSTATGPGTVSYTHLTLPTTTPV